MFGPKARIFLTTEQFKQNCRSSRDGRRIKQHVWPKANLFLTTSSLNRTAEVAGTAGGSNEMFGPKASLFLTTEQFKQNCRSNRDSLRIKRHVWAL